MNKRERPKVTGEDAKRFIKRSLENESRNKRIVKPKVENGKVLLDRENPLHQYIMDEESEKLEKMIQEKLKELDEYVEGKRSHSDTDI
jgi:hypothetical protein